MTFPTKTIRLIAKDLNKKDYLEKENSLLLKNEFLYKEKINFKDSIIKLKDQKIENDSLKFIEYDKKFESSQNINEGLKKDIKTEKGKTLFYKITTGIAVALSIFIAVK
jgi:hypothetical protein